MPMPHDYFSSPTCFTAWRIPTTSTTQNPGNAWISGSRRSWGKTWDLMWPSHGSAIGAIGTVDSQGKPTAIPSRICCRTGMLEILDFHHQPSMLHWFILIPLAIRNPPIIHHSFFASKFKIDTESGNSTNVDHLESQTLFTYSIDNNIMIYHIYIYISYIYHIYIWYIYIWYIYTYHCTSAISLRRCYSCRRNHQTNPATWK